MTRRPGGFVFDITATASSSNTRSRLLGRNSPGTVIGVDHSISRCKLSAPETHIRALPVLPGPAPGKKRRSAATGPRHPVELVNAAGTRGMRARKGRRDRRGKNQGGAEAGAWVPSWRKWAVNSLPVCPPVCHSACCDSAAESSPVSNRWRLVIDFFFTHHNGLIDRKYS